MSSPAATRARPRRERPERPTRPDPAEKRNWILDAAVRLFAERGYAKTTVDEIATEARVSKGLLYTHFSSKVELLDAVMEREINAWNRASARAAWEAGGSQLEMLATGFRTSIEYARQRPFLGAILAQDPRLLSCPRDPREREEPQRLIDYRAVVQPLLERAIALGEVRADIDPAHLARVSWLLHDGLVRAIFIGRDAAKRSEADALVETAIELLSAGLRLQQ